MPKRHETHLALDLAELDQVEPSDQDIAWAYECLRPAPFDRSPLQHMARILALYRRELVEGASG